MAIYFFTKSVSFTGGKEKVLTQLANFLSKHSYDIFICYYDDVSTTAFQMESSIQLRNMPLQGRIAPKSTIRKLYTLFQDIRYYKKNKPAFSKDDIIIPTDNLIATVIYLAWPECKKQVWVWEHLISGNVTSPFWQKLRNYSYKRFEKIIALNPEEYEAFHSLGCKAICMPNAVVQQTKAHHPAGGQIIWVGSLTKEKGAHHLTTIVQEMRKGGINIPLTIYGDGPLRESIIAEIENRKISNISWAGIITDTDIIYKKASLLLLTSAHECFPTVIIEAFSYGVPVISYDCPTGPRNMIVPGKNGWLIQANDTTAMARAIIHFFTDKAAELRMREASWESATQYDPSVIYPKWLKLIEHG